MNELDASENPAELPIKVQLFGETGTGKTFSLRTLPDCAWPVALIDIDLGSRSIHGQFNEGLFRIYQPDRVDGALGSHKPVAYDEVKALLNRINQNNDVKTIVIDSMTMLYGSILDHVVYKGKTKNIESAPTLQEYGIALRLTVKLVEALISMGTNIILICHETALENEVTGIVKGVPALTGQLGNIVPRYFDEIYHSRTEGSGSNLKYVWDTQPRGLFVARSRLQLPAVIPQDWSQLFKA
jgi:hypothetical protein|tara:strand:- start:307 stop:1029 length:723 start_codon:yes stop_codon:yes gene_type:complete